MGSLKKQFTVWLSASIAGSSFLAISLEFAEQYTASARQQDDRLLAAVRRAEEPRTGIWRLDQPDGQYIAGSRTLGSVPHPESLQPDRAVLFLTHEAGQLLRAAAIPVPQPNGTSLILQVAESLSLRFPSTSQMFPGRLIGVLVGLWCMALLAAAGAARARRWLLRSLADFEEHGAAKGPLPDELRATLQRLHELNRQQRDSLDQQRRFLAEAAHQLRTPMAVLRAQLQSIQLSEPQANPVVLQMIHTVDRASGLANQLLSLSRVEQLKRAGKLQFVSVASVVEDAVVELSPLLSRQRLGFALDGEDFEVPADPVMLGELLRNLLANAVHHSHRECNVGIVLRQLQDARELVVWDEGPGIDDAVKPRLFTPFSAAAGGVGLGLSICHQIADAMGAHVWLYNRIDAGRIVGVDAVLRWPPG